MTPLELEKPTEISRAKRLKAHTGETHDRLDRSIMAGRPFESRERYGLFLKVQQQFHRDIDALYSNVALDTLLPELARRRRLGLVEQDLTDLGVPKPVPEAPPAFGADPDIPTATGWLYVAEGSNLGAAFLLKEAEKLGLSANFGARHLAAGPEGRALNWKTFTAALDALDLTKEEEARVTLGAEAAFRRVRSLVINVFVEEPTPTG
ncbi:MAG TPA: biliverdin-producing heme oxygenase [Ancylobacter sp.]